MLKVITEIDKMKTYAKIMRKDSKVIGFVPTMGYFHEGHLSLMRAARKQCDTVIVSVYVNPAQFAPYEDFTKYPRQIKRDEELARTEGADVIFVPRDEDMYPEGYSTYVNVEGLTEKLCGKARPGHFRGVTTVVMKLFEIVKPEIAYFGQKDAQQAFVIQKMIKDLNLDITMKILATVREKDGLAMSSRNSYLKKTERKEAPIVYQALLGAERMVQAGENSAKVMTKAMRETIKKASSAKIDYISVVDTESLEDVATIKNEALVTAAVLIGKTRLIDNIIVNTNPGIR
ncbi:MAG: pantoate--beta-alanine ligase [Candidatus Omnitrophica bacterium]|nr:pantoate--beta-alanine ligase [Candidatus Omnitrophota bacterium]